MKVRDEFPIYAKVLAEQKPLRRSQFPISNLNMINLNKLDNRFYINHFKLFNSILIFFVIFIYIAVRDYNPYRMDDAWFTSFIYNDYVKNIETDTVFGGDITNGVGGTQLFGKIYTFIYGSLIQVFSDWTKQNFYFISTLFVLLSSFVWYKILVSLKIEPRYAIIICLSVLYIDVFFSAAHCVRVEAFILFLLSMSFMLALAKKYEWSIFFSLIAVETHPVGAASFFMNIPLIFDKEHRTFIFNHLKKIAIRVSLVIIAFGMLYVILHYDYLSRIWELRNASAHNSLQDNFLYRFYFETLYYRHLPELILIVISIYLYIKRGLYKNRAIILHCLISMLIFSLLLGRGRFSYTVLIYPAFVLFIFYTFISLNRLSLLISLILVFYTPQYLFLSYKNRNVIDAQDYKNFINEEVRSNSSNSLPIVGLPNDYFAFISAEFYNLCYVDITSFNQKVKEAVMITHEVSELDKYYRGLPCDNLNNINKNYSQQFIKTLKYMDESIIIYKLSRK
jgi:hypothetical protein